MWNALVRRYANGAAGRTGASARERGAVEPRPKPPAVARTPFIHVRRDGESKSIAFLLVRATPSIA
jgi:hypothetical protein